MKINIKYIIWGLICLWLGNTADNTILMLAALALIVIGFLHYFKKETA
jgi:LPXTG-motif cell wall-anchored protein